MTVRSPKRNLVKQAIRGLGLGLLVAVANCLCFPVLFELAHLIDEVKHTGSWTGPVGSIFPEFWLIDAFLGAIYLSPPSLVGGITFVGIYNLPILRKHRKKRYILPASILFGSLVAVVGMVLFFTGDLSFPFSDGWVFAVLVWITEVLIFVWLGKQIASRSEDTG